MIPCRFILKLRHGGTSDSVNAVLSVHSVPRVGETLYFVGGEASSLKNVVKDVVHTINPKDGTHEIRVYYQDASNAE